MNRLIFGRVATTTLARAARVRAHAAAFMLLMLALVATPAAAVTNAWAPASAMNTARYGQTATLLSSGKVLVAGGSGSSASLASAELYDPATNAWSAAGNLATARVYHTATLLPSGKVLVTGGRNGGSIFASAELYDPATNAWTSAGNMTKARYGHTATLLPSGKVLVVGGANSGVVGNVDLYDPATNTWSAAAPLLTARYLHTATLLPSGMVLVAGGHNGGALKSAELYDPVANTWSATGTPLVAARYFHTATLLPSGHVLVAGGNISGSPNASNPIASAELYDPATNAWSATGALADARMQHVATLLPSGKVLVAGGGGTEDFIGSVELYDPATNTWGSMSFMAARANHTATLLPTGQVLVAGGYDGGILAVAELYDPAAGAWSAAGSLAAVREAHTATLLLSGKVLVAGGGVSGAYYLASTELYDPATDSWSAAANMIVARNQHAATLLPSGRVLVVGGERNTGTIYIASAEIYDPTTNAWSAASAMSVGRTSPTATLLPSGKVLVTGGQGATGLLASAELYDPATNTWTSAGNMAAARQNHTATLLLNGQVLVAGGDTGNPSTSELYDPATNTWHASGAMNVRRGMHAAALLPSGKVLVAGGYNSTFLASAELYDPATGAWTAVGALSVTRMSPTATLLPSGKVLVAGGRGTTWPTGTELFDPATNTWSTAGNMSTARVFGTATQLASGQVLLVGGRGSSGDVASTERYTPGLAPLAAAQPGVSAVNAFLLQTSQLAATSLGSATVGNAATATGFMPLREGSSGSFGQSASNAPVFQLQRIDNDQMRFVPNDGSVAMTDTAFTGSASALAGFPAGPVRVRAWVNGVPSAARFSTLAVTPGAPAAPVATGGTTQVSVDFAAVTETGGAPVTGYVVTVSPGGASMSCAAPCANVVFDALDPGDYTFTVHATNAAGDGPESPPSNVATLTAATPVLTWAAPAAIVYGTPLDATQLNATATYNGNPVDGTFAYTPPVGSVLPAGSAQTLSVTFTPTDTVHYQGATASVSIEVMPAPLSVTGTSAQSKPYDGTATATLTGGALVGVLAADAGNVTLTQAGTFAQANVGTSIAVTANDSLGGSAANNYTLTQPTGLSADIMPATLTYTATPTTMPYGTTPGGLGGTVSGFIPGESQATATIGVPLFTTTATASSAPGQYPITGSGLSANNGNYIFVQAADNLTALTIERAEQAALSLVATPNVLIPGMTSQLAASGGSGSGAVTYAVDGGPCNVSGSVAAATGVGACVVRATKASDANYNATSATATITVQAANPLLAQAQSVNAILNAAQAIQLAGSDDNIGGPYALTYAIVDAPAHGTISNLDASTGTLTYTPAADYIGADQFTFTVASVNGTSQAATVTIAVAAPPLALLVGDGRSYVRYGQVVDYVATLTNAGSAVEALPVTFTLSDGFDADSLHIDCFAAGGDAACSQDASDPLRFTVSLQPGRTLTWLASVRVRADATDDTVTFGVDALGASGVADTNTLVIFRDGFDATTGDDAQAEPAVEGEPARAILDGDAVLDVVAPPSIGATPAPWLSVREAAREVRVEGIHVAGVVLARLFERDADSRERVSAWSAVRPGATLSLGSVAVAKASPDAAAAPPRAIVLAGTESAVALP